MSAWAGIAGDVDSSGAVDLKDAVLSLQICAGMEPAGISPDADVNNDKKIGLEEAIYILKNIAHESNAGQIYTGRIPDSGQTQCYDEAGSEIPCAGTGQDGEYLINPRSYTKLDANGNDLPDSATSWSMVRDNVTGLIWEVKQNKDDITDYSNPHDADNRYTWYDRNSSTNGGDAGKAGTGTDTEDFINALNAQNYGGHNDWRLPTIKELTSLLNRGQYDPSIDTRYFPNSSESLYYWSSSTYANPTYHAWCVNFYNGSDYYYYKSVRYSVRAVRSGQSQSFGHFVINNDGTVTDIHTGLMWQQTSIDTTMTWQDSFSYCKNLQLAGHSDWRLPNKEELRSVVDYGRSKPAIYTEYFLNTKSSEYWSSSPGASDTNDAWSVYFLNGDDYNYGKSRSYYVRAVRSGQSWVSGHLYITSPLQASHWDIGNSMPIKWDTQGITGNVKISLSRDGGLTFDEIIADSTPNDGSHTWTITGAASVNCALKVESLSDLSKSTVQSLFEIK